MLEQAGQNFFPAQFREGSSVWMLTLALTMCLAVGACAPSTNGWPSYSEQAGAIDASPKSAFGDPLDGFPPEPDGKPADLSEGQGIQAFADRLIGAKVADFVAQNVVYGRSGEFHYFYPIAQAGPGPGLCETRIYSVFRTDPAGRPSQGRWLPRTYSVIGSVAPMSQPEAQRYRERLDIACRTRRDMAVWYHAKPAEAYRAAQLADMVIAASRKPGPMPFKLVCSSFPPDQRVEPACSANVRDVVASINPRAIVQVDGCSNDRKLDCIAIGMAKLPEMALSAEESQWTLEVEYHGRTAPQIRAVYVNDTEIIID